MYGRDSSRPRGINIFTEKTNAFTRVFRGGREESRPYNTQVISALFNGHIAPPDSLDSLSVVLNERAVFPW